EEGPENELIGRRFLDHIPRGQKKYISSQVEKLREGESLQQELIIKTAKGNDRTILFSGSPLLNDEGDFKEIFAIIMDISELKELQKFNSRAQRLEMAGRIAGQVAHDFNNLLSPLAAYTELIKSELPENHSILKYIDIIQKSALQMAEINQQLLTLGRRAHFKIEFLNLGEIIKEVIAQIQPTPETLIIDVNISADLMKIKGGASQIHRLFLNLINNAREAMQDKGYLSIRAENYYLDGLIDKRNQIMNGEYIKLTVSDTGTGIPPEIIDRIFEPFFSAKSVDERKGSGLGLSIVHAVVEDHNGHIDVESAVGKGTSFFIYFPMAGKKTDISAAVALRKELDKEAVTRS
ncbi:MAG: ATP-binding protein, partial [Thermoplasmata archaeon]